MMSTRQLVTEIKQLLMIEGEIAESDIDRLGKLYLEACRQVNDRVQQCLELVRQGQRSKAIRLAKEPPDLRTEIETLDFPESVEWQMTCEMVNLSTFGVFEADALRAAVGEIYAESTTFDQLLTGFRRMSVGQAPIGDRVHVLRRIMKADPHRSEWKDDLAEFEIAYVDDLLMQAERANHGGDLQRMEWILAELSSDAWLPPKPVRVIRAVEKLILPHRQRFAAERFAELTEQLRDAHGAMDEARCRELFMEWESVVAATGVGPDTEVVADVMPTRQWLEDLDATRREDNAFNSACSRLEEAIDEGKLQPDLEKLAAEVLRFERGMPELLAARLNSRMDELARRGKRRFVLKLTGVIAAVLVLAASVSALILWHQYESAITHWSGLVEQALDADDLDAAGRYFAAMEHEDPRLKGAAAIQQLRTDYDQKMLAERERLDSFQRAIDKVSEAGMDAPDRGALEKAAELARTYDEKVQVEKWKENIARRDEEKRRELEAEREEELTGIEELYKSVLAARRAGREDAGEMEDRCLASLREFGTKPAISTGQKTRADAVERSILEARRRGREKAERQKSMQRALDRISGLADRPKVLAAELEAFAKEYPDEPMSGDFSRVAGMVAEWEALVAYCELTRGWSKELNPGNPVRIGHRKKAIEEYLNRFPSSPFEQGLQEYSTYLTVAANAWPDADIVYFKRLRDLLSSPVLLDVQAIKAKDGSRYYFEKGDVRKQMMNGELTGYVVETLTNAATFEKRTTSINLREVDTGPTTAGHCVLASELRMAMDRCKRMGWRNWETLYLRLAEAIRQSDDVDPVLQAILLKQVLSYARDSTPFVTAELQGIVSDLEQLDLDVAWLDPEDDDANRARSMAVAKTEMIASLQSMRRKVEDRMEHVGGALSSYRPVGVRVHGRTRCTGYTGSDPVDVYAMVDGTGLRRVGKLVGGRFECASNSENVCLQGMPLFVRSQ